MTYDPDFEDEFAQYLIHGTDGRTRVRVRSHGSHSIGRTHLYDGDRAELTLNDRVKRLVRAGHLVLLPPEG